MVIYVIGMIVAFVFGLLDYKYEEVHSYNNGADLQIGMLAPITLLSWVSVALLLIYRWKQIRWAIWFLSGK